LFSDQEGRRHTAVVESCAKRLIHDGLLAIVPTTEADLPRGFETTERGRIAIRRLLLRQIPQSQGNFTRLCMSVKLYLFHFLEAHQRRSQIAELSGLYRQTLEQLRRLHPRQGQPRSFPADYWLCHEIERLESELAWLEGLENWFSSRHACGVSELGVRAMMIWRGLEPTRSFACFVELADR
jgi:Putative AphA-like transcriptional regulator